MSILNSFIDGAKKILAEEKRENRILKIRKISNNLQSNSKKNGTRL